MREANPPDVDFDEPSGTYQLTSLRQPSIVNPEFLERTQKELLKRAIAKVLDPAKITALMDDVGAELREEAIRRVSEK
jgi:hypothetical protein